MNYLLIAAGGALGSVMRYLMQSLIGRSMRPDFPFGTLVVNITGSIIMGMFAGWLARAAQGSQEQVRLFVAIGILGGYTTFSSFSLDAVYMLQQQRFMAMGVYVAVSVIASVAGLLLGMRFMHLFL